MDFRLKIIQVREYCIVYNRLKNITVIVVYIGTTNKRPKIRLIRIIIQTQKKLLTLDWAIDTNSNISSEMLNAENDVSINLFDSSS